MVIQLNQLLVWLIDNFNNFNLSVYFGHIERTKSGSETSIIIRIYLVHIFVSKYYIRSAFGGVL